MYYFISDLHFSHNSVNKSKDMRGFSSVEELDNHMVHQWNSKVGNKDTVIVLGDFSMAKGKETNKILSRLKGKKWLIIGNHDKLFLNDSEFNTNHFELIEDYKEFKINKKYIIMSHYPILTYNKQFSKNTYMLHGHIHNTTDQKLVDKFVEVSTNFKRENSPVEYAPCNLINCFCMYSNYTPMSLEEWIELDKQRRLIGSKELINMQCSLDIE